MTDDEDSKPPSERSSPASGTEGESVSDNERVEELTGENQYQDLASKLYWQTMDEIFGNPIWEEVDELLGNSDDDEKDHDYAGISTDNLVREYSQHIREQQHGL